MSTTPSPLRTWKFTATVALAFAATLFSARARAQSDEEPLSIRFDVAAVSVHGITPGGDAVVFGVERGYDDTGTSRSTTFRLLTDSDHDAAEVLDLGRPVALRGVWVVADLASGRTIWASADGSSIRALAPGPGAAANGYDPSLAVPVLADHLELMVARPGQGAWVVTAYDGGLADLDGAPDGTMEVQAAASVLTEGPVDPVQGLRTGDLVLGVDPISLDTLSEVVDLTSSN
jgi:hypothetical protein